MTAAFSPRVRTLNTRRGGGRPREARRVVRARGVWSGGVRGKPQLVRYEYIPPSSPLQGRTRGRYSYTNARLLCKKKKEILLLLLCRSLREVCGLCGGAWPAVAVPVWPWGARNTPHASKPKSENGAEQKIIIKG